VFLGMRNPNPGIEEMAVASELRTLSDELGLTGRHVYFNEAWVPYEERGAWLLDADVAISMHHDHLETRFSFRTRVLDYLWARRPMVLTGGDELSEVVERAGLGLTVAPGDVQGVDAVTDLLGRPPRPEAFDPVIDRYVWSTVAAPLLGWCGRPLRAADHLSPTNLPGVSNLPAAGAPRREAEARVEAAAPGYLARVREAAAVLAVGPDRSGDLRASLAGVRETADVDIDVPTLSRQAPLRLLKVAIKALIGWYLRYVGDQVTALGHAVAGFGDEVVERADELGEQQDATAARVAALEARVRDLEAERRARDR
jgi:hypothetical protein